MFSLHFHANLSCISQMCLVNTGQHGAVREGKDPFAFLIVAAGDFSSEGDALRCLRSIGTAHQKPH